MKTVHLFYVRNNTHWSIYKKDIEIVNVKKKNTEIKYFTVLAVRLVEKAKKEHKAMRTIRLLNLCNNTH